MNNIEEDKKLQQLFDKYKVDGTFGIFDNGAGRFTIHNLGRFRDSLYTPASTFKVVNSLIGLHTGVVNDEKTVIKWDGVTRWNPEWNKDLTMEQAFRASAVPWYQELARQIGKDTMQYWIDSIGYGKQFKRPVITAENIDTFWLNNSVKVSADEQLGLMKRLYFDQLPFQKRVQRIVRQMMLQEDNANYKLSYKTGMGTTEKGKTIGWVVGWIEENKHVFPFVLQVETGDRNMELSKIRIDLLKDILKEQGFFEGKK
jgi:beta-lactamase class D